jgi:hypothetical protein
MENNFLRQVHPGRDAPLLPSPLYAIPTTSPSYAALPEASVSKKEFLFTSL